MRRLILTIVVLGVIAAIAFYFLTMPRPLSAAALPAYTPDVKNGKYIFDAAGCSGCHAKPIGKTCADPKSGPREELAGGRCLKTPFGTFYAPNISPDKQDGIGNWSQVDFVNAVTRGLSPSGAHLYPAFPYTSYAHMKIEDVLDLKAYIDTLPAVKSDVPDHDLALPFRLRRGLGLWKLLFLDRAPFQPDASRSAEINRGAYLVNAPGHCGECHTPRNVLGGREDDKLLAGGPAPEGKGYIPNITPDRKTGLGDWSVEDITYLLETGFTPSFDTVGGSMVEVQENMARLSGDDRKAIALYLKSVPPIVNAHKRQPREKPSGDGKKETPSGGDTDDFN